MFNNNAIVCIMNDDTVIQKNYLLNAVDVFSQNKELNIIVPSIAINNSNGKKSSIGEYYDQTKMTFEHSDIIEKINCLSTWGLFIKVDDFIHSGGFYPKLLPHYLSDFEYTLRQINNGMKIIANDNLIINFFPEHSGFESAKMGNEFKPYIKALFSKKNKSNPFYWIVFVMLTAKFPFCFINGYRIAKNTLRQMAVVLYRSIKTEKNIGGD